MKNTQRKKYTLRDPRFDYRNKEEIPGSPDISPDNSPETETVLSVPSVIKYIVYCHGEMVNQQFVVPHLVDRTSLVIESLVEDFNILSGDQYNMIEICKSDYIPKTIVSSGNRVYDMNLIGGAPLGIYGGVDLGIYVCTELNNATFNISNFTQEGNRDGTIYATTLQETIKYITSYHNLHFRAHPLRIILHTCRVAQNVPTPVQAMTQHTADDDLSNYFDTMNIKDNEMDTSGGKKKSKTSRIKKTKKIKKTKNNKKLRK